ncbi:MAG: amidohydrolase family protein, partial [Deltaproteobacteria bacterium]|nr:amidohydrolase family protein [Deltaproteobacteria bacterium]MBW2026913.1 amidohydrolase family protein [Deltaproteobacteria bacterium]
LGASWLKTLHQEHSYSYYPRTLPNHSDEGYNAILEIGAEHGVRCALHQPLLSGFVKGVKLGFHTLEHMPMDGIIPRRAIETFIKKGMAIIPTMMAFADVFSETSILKLIQEHGREYLTPEAIRQMTARLKASLAQNKLSIQERRKLIFDREYFRDMFSNQLTNLSRLHETGATIGLGTDNGGTFSGFFGRYAKELEHYVTAGIPKHEILKMATSVNASILGMQDEIGSISKGKIADIIAVRGNPLKNISVMSKVDMVMKGGTFIKYEGLSLT